MLRLEKEYIVTFLKKYIVKGILTGYVNKVEQYTPIMYWCLYQSECIHNCAPTPVNIAWYILKDLIIYWYTVSESFPLYPNSNFHLGDYIPFFTWIYPDLFWLLHSSVFQFWYSTFALFVFQLSTISLQQLLLYLLKSRTCKIRIIYIL